MFYEISRVFGACIRSQLEVALSLVTIGLTIAGVPDAVLLGAFAGIVELVPMLGPFLGAIPALLIASTLPFPAVLWTAIMFVPIQQFESNVLVPWLMRHAVGLHPLAAMLALLAGFKRPASSARSSRCRSWAWSGCSSRRSSRRGAAGGLRQRRADRGRPR